MSPGPGLLAVVSAGVADAIVVIDASGRILLANDATTRIFGHERGELLGANVRLLMPDPQRSEHDRYLASYLASGQAKILNRLRTVTALRKDGSTFPLELHISSHEDCFVGVLRDVSSRQPSSGLTPPARHELRNQLTTLQGALDLLADDALALPCTAQALVQLAASSASTLSRRVATLIALARLDTSSREPTADVDLADIAAAAVASLTYLAKARGVRLSPAPATALRLVAPPKLLALVVESLIEAAIAATTTAGAVRFSLVERGGFARLSACGEGSPGVGGPTEGSSSPETDLSVAARLAEAHGGRLVVDGAPGGAFHLDWPSA